MAEVSISEAAKLVGKSRKSLYRHVKDGKLSVSQSVSGKTIVETSELIRVYGALRQVETVIVTPTVTGRDTNRDSMESLANEIKLLREEVSGLKREVSSLKALPAPDNYKQPARKGNKWVNAMSIMVSGMGAAIDVLK